MIFFSNCRMNAFGHRTLRTFETVQALKAPLPAPSPPPLLLQTKAAIAVGRNHSVPMVTATAAATIADPATAATNPAAAVVVNTTTTTTTTTATTVATNKGSYRCGEKSFRPDGNYDDCRF